MQKNNIIIIAGPTGVGKTKLSINLAKKLNTEIISSDSMQIYKYMNIGTDKISDNNKEGIKHHLIDFVDPRDEYTVADFSRDATNIFETLFKKNKIPIIVGGTGLYINSLIYEMDFGNAKKNERSRQKYNNILNNYGKDVIYDIYLKKIEGKDNIEKIHPNNLKRIIRFLEISEVNNAHNSFTHINFKNGYNSNLFVLNRNRQKLYENINNRVDEMIEEGLIDEVKTLREKNILKRKTQAAEAIGYREMIQYLDGKINLEESIRLIKGNSRRYAKKQLTWFRRYDFAKWIDLESLNVDEVSDIIIKSSRNEQ